MIKNGDLFGTPPSGIIAKLACRILKARTFHWGLILGQDKDGYISSESIGKGTAVTRFAYNKAYIYRIKKLKHEPYMYRLISFHSQHGEATYDMQVNFLTGIWFLFKHYLKIVLPIIKNHTFNCQEHVVYMASCMGVKIIGEDEYPYCINLENSKELEFIGEWRNNLFYPAVKVENPDSCTKVCECGEDCCKDTSL
jgi:hypothetical protein